MNHVRIIVLSPDDNCFSEIKAKLKGKKIEVINIKKSSELLTELAVNPLPSAVFASDQNRFSFIKKSIKMFRDYSHKIPFYIITKNPSVEDSVKFIKLGADNYLDFNQKRSLNSYIKNNSIKSSDNFFPDAFLRKVIENIEEGIWIIDENNITTFANNKLNEILGISFDNIIGKSFYDLIDKANYSIWDEFISNRQHGQKKGFDLNLKRSDDKKSLIHFSTSYMYDSAKNYKGVLAFVKDVTQKKKVERELLENENKYRMLFENNPAPMLVFNISDFQILAVNDAALHQYGYSEEEFLKLTVKDIRPKEDLPDFISHISKIRKKYHKNDIWRHKKKDGSVFYVQVTSHSIKYNEFEARLVIANDVSIYQKYEQEIKESETKYKALFEDNPNSIWIINKETMNIVEVNKASINLYQLPEDKIIGKKFSHFFNDNLDVSRLNGRVLSGEKKLTACHKIGFNKIITVEISIHPVEFSGCEYYLAIINDITEKKRAEKEIIAWKQRYEVTVAASDQIVYDYILNSGEVLWSGSLEKVLGYSQYDFRDGIEQWVNLIHPDDRSEAVALLEKAEKNNHYFDFSYRFKNKDGIYIWMHDRGFFINNANGEPERMLGMMQNVNAKKIAEEENRKSKKQLQHLFDASPAIIYSAKIINGNISNGWMSDNISRLLGYVPSEFSDFGNWFKVIHEDDRESAKQVIKNITKTNHSISEYRVKHKNGAQAWLRDEANLLRDENGIPQEIVGSLSDITERKAIEKAGVAFADLGHKLSSALSVKEASWIIADTADKLLGWEAISLDLYTREYDKIIPVLVIDTIDGERREFNNTDSVQSPSKRIRKVLENGGQLILRTKNEMRDLELFPFGDKQKPSASILVVPIKKGELCIGVLSIHSYAFNNYSEASLDTLQRLADHCAGALERFRVEYELKLSEIKYRDIFSFAPIGIFQTGLDGKIITANLAFSQMLGYDSIDEILRINMNDIHLNSNKRKDILFKLDENSYQRQMELEWKKKNGDKIWVSLNAHAIKDEKQKLVYYEGFVNNISEQKKIAIELIDSRKKYKELADLLPQVIFETDISGNLTFVNQSSFKIFGYNAEDFEKGLNIFQMIVPEEHEKVKASLAKLYRGESISNHEHNAVKKDGTIYPVDVYSNAIYVDGKPSGIRGILIDITDRKKAIAELIFAKEKAEEANRLKSGFLSTMSHEIRTPLNAILGFNSVIKDIYYQAADEEIRQCFNSMEDAGMRLLNTITQVLDASRIEAHEFPINIKSLSLVDAVDSAYNMLNIFAEKKGLKIVQILPSDDVIIRADEYCLNGVLINLITNAIKYSNKGEIKISITEASNYGVCTVEDEGIGMSEEYQKHLFETFSQENVGMDRPFEGTGLGLALANRYLEMMNGKIEVKSIKHYGTKITFSIPKI